MLENLRQSRNTISQPGIVAVFARASDSWHALFTHLNAAGRQQVESILTHTRGRQHLHRSECAKPMHGVYALIYLCYVTAGDSESFCFLLSLAAAPAAVPVEPNWPLHLLMLQPVHEAVCFVYGFLHSPATWCRK